MLTCQPVSLPLRDIAIFGPIMRQEVGWESQTKATHAKNWVSIPKASNEKVAESLNFQMAANLKKIFCTKEIITCDSTWIFEKNSTY